MARGTLPAVPGVTTAPLSSFPIGSAPGTSAVNGVFVGTRPHSWGTTGVWLRFYNPRDPASKWNGYFFAFFFDSGGAADDRTMIVDLSTSSGTTNDSSLVIMGAEIRGVAVASCRAAVVEQNQIHNCWIVKGSVLNIDTGGRRW